jgi:hypothetical protein
MPVVQQQALQSTGSNLSSQLAQKHCSLKAPSSAAGEHASVLQLLPPLLRLSCVSAPHPLRHLRLVPPACLPAPPLQEDHLPVNCCYSGEVLLPLPFVTHLDSFAGQSEPGAAVGVAVYVFVDCVGACAAGVQRQVTSLGLSPQ